MAEKSVAEQVQDLREKWNPKGSKNLALEVAVGAPRDESDTRATVAAGQEVWNQGKGDDGDDTSHDDLTPPDSEDYDEWSVKQLRSEIDKRNVDRDDESRLIKSGTKDDLVERLREDDDGDESDDDD